MAGHNAPVGNDLARQRNAADSGNDRLDVSDAQDSCGKLLI